MAARVGGSTLNGTRGVRPDMDFPKATRECNHADLEDLGWGGAIHYFRCAACGAPVMTSGSSLWVLRPITPGVRA